LNTQKECIRFLLNDDGVSLFDVRPTETLLDYLRLKRGLTGAKDGCAGGDCGACTVLIGRLVHGALCYESINACIRFLGSLHATHIVTVEYLTANDSKLHPVQQALVDCHGAQCGFCSPGIVMSLYGLWLSNSSPSRANIEKALQGNLCRCTGYEPIIKAAELVSETRPSALFDPIERRRVEIASKLQAIHPRETIDISTSSERSVIPGSVEKLVAFLAENPDATIVAGSTDVGLWATKQMRKLKLAVFINHLTDLQIIRSDPTGIYIGAGVTYSQAFRTLAAEIPQLALLLDRIGGEQVRNMGTLGGNIANGSPVGDMSPPLIALDSTVTLRSLNHRRTIPLESFFTESGKQDCLPGEIIESIFVPRPLDMAYFAVYKLSKRRNGDISTLCGAFHLTLDGKNGVSSICISFGGMAGTPKRAAHVEAALKGKLWTEETVLSIRNTFDSDFFPLTDWRATAEYRQLAAKNLLTRFYFETLGKAEEIVRFENPVKTLMKGWEAFKARGDINSPMCRALKHDSAHKHVSGGAEFIDDMPEPAGLLHGALGFSSRAHANILSMDLSEVESSPGVICVLTGRDIPGINDISENGLRDEPLLAETEVQFYGQLVFAVIAETRNAARLAATKARIEYENLPFWTDIDGALQNGAPLVAPPMTLKRGEAETEIKKAPMRLSGTLRIGGQEHFYLESHIAVAIPGEDDEMTVWSSTQHPSEIQRVVSQVLNVPLNAITVNVRRIGGGFGGKEIQGNLFAALASIAAKKLKRPIKFRPDRNEDMRVTGKRHDFRVDYEIGFDKEGNIHAVQANYAARCGYAADHSGPVTSRALFHADSSYFYPHVTLTSQPLKTHTVSNTAFRGFGGPQGMLGGERIIEEIAYALGKDPLEIRKRNFYGEKRSGRALTPYHQTVEDNIIVRIVEELEASSDYQVRRQAAIDFNQKSRVIKKGIALTPVKFGISFTMTALNQAGALVHIYQDGSIHLNHGGTEMGQGLHTKVVQVLADAFQVDIDKVQITSTTTGKVPNTSATAASSGSDLNGMAILDAANQIKGRLIAFATKKWKVKTADVEFLPNRIKINGKEEIPFPDFIKQAYLDRIQLSATGFYKTPDIHLDQASGKGRPFYYFAYGAACSEVSIDTLTGEYIVERTDILHDVGKSLNPAIDVGQVEGAFVQGLGWLTTEELWWDDKGQLRTYAPSSYKIPLASDRPKIFNVKLVEWSENKEPSIGRSKAVGEPPLLLAISVLEALSMAVASVADYRICPKLDTPATPESILMAVERIKLKVV